MAPKTDSVADWQHQRRNHLVKLEGVVATAQKLLCAIFDTAESDSDVAWELDGGLDDFEALVAEMRDSVEAQIRGD